MYVLFMTRRRWPGTEWSGVWVTRHEPVDRRGSVESLSCSAKHRQMFESPGFKWISASLLCGGVSGALLSSRAYLHEGCVASEMDTGKLAAEFKDHRGRELVSIPLFHNGIYQLPD